MRLPSRLHMLFAVAVLAGSLALAGCPKNPEVTQSRPVPVGPAAATSPGAGGGAGAPGAAGSSTSAGDCGDPPDAADRIGHRGSAGH